MLRRSRSEILRAYKTPGHHSADSNFEQSMKRNPADRVLVIGLDMGDMALIEKWSLEGFLPTFRSLMSEGMWGKLKTTAEALHTSSWPTLFTGTLPGKHGVYYPYQPRPGRQHAEHIGPDQYGAPPFWQILDRAGKRCIVLDAPETFPVTDFNGVQIFEWGTWAWYWKRMTTPVEIERQLTNNFGPHPLKLEAMLDTPGSRVLRGDPEAIGRVGTSQKRG